MNKTEEKFLQEGAQRIHDRGIFVGCPLEAFASTSHIPYEMARRHGLRVTDQVLEIGCGCLRVGFWFIRRQAPGCYHGIEPNQEMLEAGKKEFLRGTECVFFDTNYHFDFSVFEKTFDFFIAFSIWSHASKGQIEKMLDGFVQHGNPGAKFLATWIPAGDRKRDYEGDTWVGKSHFSDQKGTVGHAESWVNQAATKKGLTVHVLPEKTLHQQWLLLSKPPATSSS